MAGSGVRPVGIFVSYRRADAGWPARWLVDRLSGQFGAGVVFQDVDSIRPGDDFAAEIEAAVGSCLVLLAVIGRRWLDAEGDAGRRLDDPRDWVRLEIETAIRRGVRIIPVLVDGATLPAADELPPSLRALGRRQAVTLSPASLDIRRLLSVLETALAHEDEGSRRAGAGTLESAEPARSRSSRLLMSAVHAASSLASAKKAEALCPVIRAASLIAPDRVDWLTAEAETAARSVEDAESRSWRLAEVAGAAAAANPGRAESIARSIENASWRGSALAEVAGKTADPERAAWLAAEAEIAARSIEDASERASALVFVAAGMAAADPGRAEDIARSIEDTYWRVRALAQLARLAVQPDR